MKTLAGCIVFLFTFIYTALGQHFFTDADYKLDLAKDFPAAVVGESPGELVLAGQEQTAYSRVLPIPLTKTEPFITAALRYEGPSARNLLAHFSIRFSEDGQEWREWIPVQEDLHIADETEQSRRSSRLIFAEATDRYFQLAVSTGPSQELRIQSIALFFSCPGRSAAPGKGHVAAQSRGVCPLPSYQGRNDWCSTSECPFGANPVYTDVTHLIVHHSAGSNTSSDWAAVVRAIWHYHVDQKGWDDIGYNWLIDRNGVLYQGRPDNIKGAHFSGHNTGTMGVCVLGNFQNATPPAVPSAAALETLEHLLCWKSEQKGLDPLATTYHASSGLQLKVISGHRDGGQTSCPGDSLYYRLPAIRLIVDSLLHPVATHEAIASGPFEWMPVLAQNIIYLRYSGAARPLAQMEIISPAGQVVIEGEITGETAIDISNLPQGLYFIRLTGAHVFQAGRFVKQ